MDIINQNFVPTTREDVLAARARRPYVKMYRILRKDFAGLDVFDKDGKSDGISGAYLLQMLLDYFLAEECYWRCAYLKYLLEQFVQRWPQSRSETKSLNISL
jgi:hypothetical protein